MLSQNDYLSSKRKLKKNPLCRLQKKRKNPSKLHNRQIHYKIETIFPVCLREAACINLRDNSSSTTYRGINEISHNYKMVAAVGSLPVA